MAITRPITTARKIAILTTPSGPTSCNKKRMRYELYPRHDRFSSQILTTLVRLAETVSVMALPASHRFDAIVLDKRMPKATGIDVCEQIRLNDRRIAKCKRPNS